MEIFGRHVKAYRIRGRADACVYVEQKEGDCPKKNDPKYRCMDNCGGNFVIARYHDHNLYSVFGLALEELQIDEPDLNHSIYSSRNHRIALPRSGLVSFAKSHVNSLKDMRNLAETNEYELETEEKHISVLYRNNEQEAVFYPCYLAYKTSAGLFLPEARYTIQEVHANLDKVLGEAEECGVEIFLKDPIIGPIARVGNPETLETIRLLGGQRAMDVLEEIKKHV